MLKEEWEQLPALIRPKEAARITGLSSKTLARLFDEGRLDGLVLHRHRRYLKMSLRSLVEGRMRIALVSVGELLIKHEEPNHQIAQQTVNSHAPGCQPNRAVS